jgi:hypothetical protein
VYPFIPPFPSVFSPVHFSSPPTFTFKDLIGCSRKLKSAYILAGFFFSFFDLLMLNIMSGFHCLDTSQYCPGFTCGTKRPEIASRPFFCQSKEDNLSVTVLHPNTVSSRLTAMLLSQT